MAIKSINYRETSPYISLKLLKGCELDVLDNNISTLQVSTSRRSKVSLRILGGSSHGLHCAYVTSP